MICRKCGTEIDKVANRNAEGYLVCPNCGTMYRPVVRQASEAASAPAASAPAASAVRPAKVKRTAPKSSSSKKLSRKAIFIGAGALAVLVAAIVILIIMLGGSSGKYKIDINATIDEMAKIEGYSAEEVREAKKEAAQYEEVWDMLFLEMDDGKVYLSAEADNAFYTLLANSSDRYNYKLSWADRGGVLVLVTKRELTKEGMNELKEEYNEYYSDYYDSFEEYLASYDYEYENTIPLNYSLKGKKLTISYEGYSFSFTRSSGSSGLAGTWDVDLEQVRKTLLNAVDDSEARSIISSASFDEEDKLSITLNKDGTLSASAKVLAGTYEDGIFSLRSEAQQALSEERMSLGIQFEEKSGKLYLTITVFERGRQEGQPVTVVLKKA